MSLISKLLHKIKNKFNVSIIFTIFAMMSLTSCATVTGGTHQKVSVKTGNVQGANCLLENNKGKWTLNNTPGTVTVNRSFDDLTVHCSKSGYPAGNQLVKSHTKALAFGNILLGGAIGAGVDAASGAAYDYPSDINVPLKRIA